MSRSDAPTLLTVDEAAARLRMSDKQLRGHIRAGNIGFVDVGLGARPSYRFRASDVDAFQTFQATAAQVLDEIFEVPEPIAASPAARSTKSKSIKASGRPDKPPRRGFVYFVSDGTFIKIGWASNWRRRMIGIQVTNPHPLKVLAVLKGSTLRERALHRKFAKHHTRGEWYRHHTEIVEYVAGLSRKGLNCLSEVE